MFGNFAKTVMRWLKRDKARRVEPKQRKNVEHDHQGEVERGPKHQNRYTNGSIRGAKGRMRSERMRRGTPGAYDWYDPNPALRPHSMRARAAANRAKGKVAA